MMHTTIDIEQPRGGPLVRWGAIVTGAVWGLALMAVLTSLWLALAYPSDSEVVRDNLEWFMAGSGALSLFVAGLLAGMLTDNRGPGSGWLHGMTAWGTLLIAALVFGVPSIFGLFSAGQLRTIDGGDLVGQGASDAMWATFLTLVVGAVAAAIGGAIGGAPRRSVGTTGLDAARYAERDDGLQRGYADRDDDLDRTDGTMVMRTDPSNEEVDGRVMVRRAADGSYVDQHGRRFMPESTGVRRSDSDIL